MGAIADSPAPNTVKAGTQEELKFYLSLKLDFYFNYPYFYPFNTNKIMCSSFYIINSIIIIGLPDNL